MSVTVLKAEVACCRFVVHQKSSLPKLVLPHLSARPQALNGRQRHVTYTNFSGGMAAAIAAGNAAFVDEDYDAAVQGYSSAIEAEPSNADAFAKRAAVQLKLKRYTEAVSDATASIKLQATSKAYARKGQGSFALGEFEAARGAFAKALDMLQGTKGKMELERWVRKCDAEIALESAPASEPPVDISSAGVNPMAPPPAAAPSAASAADPNRIRHEWYQTQTHVIVSVLARNVPKEKVSVEFGETEVDVGITLDSAAEYQLSLALFHKVSPPTTPSSKYSPQSCLGRICPIPLPPSPPLPRAPTCRYVSGGPRRVQVHCRRGQGRAQAQEATARQVGHSRGHRRGGGTALPLPLVSSLPLPLVSALPLPLVSALPLPLVSALPLPLVSALPFSPPLVTRRRYRL